MSDISKDQKTVVTAQVSVIRLSINANNKEEIIKIISDELEKYPDMHSFTGILSGISKGKPVISNSLTDESHIIPNQPTVLSNLTEKKESRESYIENSNSKLRFQSNSLKNWCVPHQSVNDLQAPLKHSQE